MSVGYKQEIRSLSELTQDLKTDLSTSIIAGEYNLLLGAGVSLDATNGRGDPLPGGPVFKAELCTITNARISSSLQRVFLGLTPNQVEKHVTERFLKCVPGNSLLPLPGFVWRRIFTLNVDDALEAAYKRPGNFQTSKPHHFKDTYEEPRSLETVPIIHLHGWAREPEKGYVFSREEYAGIIGDQNAWMTVLAEVMPVEPFIISGTTLDEIDVAYYLSKRSSSSSRKDRGPSFFIEPFPDGQTKAECERHGLTLYHGTIEAFLTELNELTPSRSTPYDLLPANTTQLFPPETDSGLVFSFASDFTRIPTNPPITGEGHRFARGNPPDWSDLARNWDVGRTLTTRVRSTVEAALAGTIDDRVIVILDHTGSGKTTVCRRVSYDQGQKGVTVLECTALARLDIKATAEALDLISKPLLILLDNFADQANSVANILASTKKRNVVFLCAERDYRAKHIQRAIGDTSARIVNGLNLNTTEAIQLIDTYVKRGMAGVGLATKSPGSLAKQIVEDPIAVACCHILKDMRPLDMIVETTYNEASPIARSRYLVATLAHICYSGGVRYEVLSGVSSRAGWDEQFEDAHPLPLEYFGDRKDFVVPMNATLAERTLSRAPEEDVAKAFERLALGIAARVNRDAIKRRAPEARLAGRLFDFDDVIRRFLHNGAGAFYKKVQPAWQWNSRYWEQVALYNLSLFRSNHNHDFLQQAISHARHAASIDPHAFSLTTLGKIILTQISFANYNRKFVYAEAFDILVKAIESENKRGRATVHAYITLFRGTIDYHKSGEALSVDQLIGIDILLDSADNFFAHDKELRETTNTLRGYI